MQAAPCAGGCAPRRVAQARQGCEEEGGLGLRAAAGRSRRNANQTTVSLSLPPWPLRPEGDSRRLKGAIQRSTETGLAVEMPSRTLRQASHESIEDSMNSYGSEGK